MGKKRTKRFSALRPNPISASSEGDQDLQCDLNAVPVSVANILEKLQAPSTEERECGCQLLATMVSQPGSIEHLLKENVLRIVAPLFLDPNMEVRRSALGALRNMSVYGSEEVCEQMMNSDILTPLSALIKQFDSPEKNSSKGHDSFDVLIEALALLSNLCEGSPSAVKIFNKEAFLPLLLQFLKVEENGYPVAIAVAHLLFIVSENNPEVVSILQEAQLVATMFAIISATPVGVDAVLLRTYVIGILLNLSEVDLTSHYRGIVQALAAVVDMDCLSLVVTALDGVKKEEEQASNSSESLDTWPEVIKLIQAQGVSLELLANLCCSDDEWEEMDCEGSEESSDDQAGEATGGKDEEMDEQSSLCLPSEINTAFLEAGVLSKILKKAQPIELAQRDDIKKSQSGKNALERLTELQSRALLCVSNVLSALDSMAVTQLDTPLSEIWSHIYSMARQAQASSSVDEDYRWAVSSAMRATLQQMAQLNAPQFGDVTESDIDFLVSFGASSKNRETQVNVVRVICTVGCVLSVQDPPHPLLARIGKVLLDVSCGTEDLVVIAEALDSIFDVFKEDHTDSVVKSIALVDRLKSLQPIFKAKVSSQRKKLGENYGVVMMAKSNLAGYIKYKMSQK